MIQVPVSVLERGSHFPEAGDEQALRDVVRIARTADACGYHRIWVAEHHSARRSACSFPAVLIAHLATQTSRIRVGSGGVMLTNHAPYTVAEQFATLQALNPGRIDLGIGRASGGSTASHRRLEAALRRDPRAGAEFPAQVDELLGFLHHEWPEGHRYHALPLTPHPVTPPGVHVLGAGEGSARVAAERGLSFAYGHHLSRTISRPEAAARYRSSFTPGPSGAQPHLIVSANVVCAETDQEAEQLALDTALWMVRHPEGPEPADRLSPERGLSPARELYLAREVMAEYQVVHGAPETVASALERLRADLEADEIMLVPIEYDGAARSRTLRLVAEAGIGIGAGAEAGVGVGVGVEAGVGAGVGAGIGAGQAPLERTARP